MLDGGRVNFFGAEGFADTRQKIAERQECASPAIRERKGRGNILDAAAFLHQAACSFPTA
jgi:hypothetical protein